MQPTKRQRSANFSKFEIHVLDELVGKYRDIIENKKTDGASVRQKAAAWREIEQEFNKAPGVTHRTSDNLKTWLDNFKRRNPKTITGGRIESRMKGGVLYTNNWQRAIPVENHSVKDVKHNSFQHIAIESSEEEEVVEMEAPSRLQWHQQRLLKQTPSTLAMEECDCARNKRCLQVERTMKQAEHLKLMDVLELQRKYYLEKLEIAAEKKKYWQKKNQDLNDLE